MWRLQARRLFWIMVLALKKIVESILIVVALSYVVLVFDIYINTERLSKVDSSLNSFCQNVANNPNFTKGSVTFRVDRGTMIHRLYPYVNWSGVYAYAPLLIFPHHQTVIISEKVIRGEYLDVLVAHEMGHIQGGLESFGKIKDMEKYADTFAKKIVGRERLKSFNNYLIELSRKEP